ncbi:uncharacterized protein CLUP02_08404 [Colletotrichum lupini]|uniref:Uncharacterized protein n=1 Tax=Colletotrichum lupini TaxID=145971 RepID=A0A9Q8WGV9_9PEZI|nr:uncharacterized protein CLUP02_08404 [Colletotrichum lupini]UQC82914.1 hypothetical protein CLUP02_08404 [Colletotrichum lupini]
MGLDVRETRKPMYRITCYPRIRRVGHGSGYLPLPVRPAQSSFPRLPSLHPLLLFLFLFLFLFLLFLFLLLLLLLSPSLRSESPSLLLNLPSAFLKDAGDLLTRLLSLCLLPL